MSGNVVEDQIRLNWAIYGGNTCEGTLIQRSGDGLSFETIGEIAGICGSPDVDVPYVFYDERPLTNRVNYYRLELGSQGYTTILPVEYVVFNNNGYHLSLDPDTRSVVIQFNNDTKADTRFGFYTTNGKLIHSGQTNDSKIFFTPSVFAGQILIFKIFSAINSISGKFFIR